MSCPLTKFELIPQQFEDGVKILRSVADRDAVVWIWCYSNNALQKLNNCDALKKLIAIVRKSVKATSNVLEYKTNIDRDQLKKNLVSIPLIIVDFRTILSFKGETLSENRSSYSDTVSIIDVAKLKMKIYVLCTIRSWPLVEQMICVFEGRDPYSIVEEISLRRFYVSKFKSMVSSVKENCLYVLTSGDKEENHYVDEVIRFEVKDDEENSLQDPSKWLELEQGFQPSVLSMSRDEDLMMVSSSSPIILRIYDPDARLRLSVSLHGDIVRTRKAVETSDGNFIIMHSMKRQTEDGDNGDRAKETNDEDSIEAEKRALLWTVSEVSRDGTTIIRRFIPQNQQQQLNIPPFSYEGDLCADSEGRVFVANSINERVIVLDSYLRWIGILIPRFKNWDEMEELRWPLKLFYDEDSHEMIVAERDQVKIFDLIHK